MKSNIENAFSILMKFGSEENLKKLQHGQLYMKNLRYYVNQEKNTGDQCVGDLYDGQMLVHDIKMKAFTVEGKQLIFSASAPNMALDLGYLDKPIFCMFKFDYRNITSEKIEGNNLIAEYRFSDSQMRNIKDFGEYVLVVKDANKFIERIKEALNREEYDLIHEEVKYYGKNLVQHIRDVHEFPYKIAFWKRDLYEYQQEYRFLVDTEVEDHLSVNIGDISDITKIYKTEEVLNTFLQNSFSIKK